MNSRGTVDKFATKCVHYKNNLCTILFMMKVLHIFHTGWNNFVSFLLTDHALSKCFLLFSLKIIILNAVHKYCRTYELNSNNDQTIYKVIIIIVNLDVVFTIFL